MSFGTGPFGTEPFGTVPQEPGAAGSRHETVVIGAANIRLEPDEMKRLLGRVLHASAPPPNAERVVCYLLPKRQREAILGDLEEDYRTTFLPKFGPREARRMYWSQFIRSVAAIMPGWIWAVVAGAFTWLWGKVGS
jgi:hypothetical protein